MRAGILMSISVVTLYYVDRDTVAPVAVFRLVDGHVSAESLGEGTSVVDEWLEGTWDPDADEMITPDMGERYLQALVNRPMTYARFEAGEPDPTFGWYPDNSS